MPTLSSEQGCNAHHADELRMRRRKRAVLRIAHRRGCVDDVTRPLATKRLAARVLVSLQRPRAIARVHPCMRSKRMR